MRMKYLLIGLFAGILLATAGTSFAESVTEKVTAYLRPDFQMDIDGQQVKLENAPLIYNDASYLPVRELSSILGKDVDFKDDTILLSSKEENAMPDLTGWVSLADLKTEGIIVYRVGFIEGDSPDSAYRQLTITADDQVIIFTVPNVIVGDTLLINDSQQELRYVNSQPYIKESLFQNQ